MKTYLFPTFIHPAPDDFEAWLEKLALKGLHPKAIGQFSSVFMSFKKGEPKSYRYVLDLQAAPKSDYITMYTDFGWELCGQMASTYLWRKEYSGKRPESFTDKESLTLRNKRFVLAIMFSLILFAVAAAVITVCFFISLPRLDASGYVQFGLGLALSYALTAYLIYAVIKIKRFTD